MKRLVFVWLMIAIPGCALGKIDDAIDNIKGTLGDLHTAECIRECTDVAEGCLDEANGICVDTCEVNEDECDAVEAACVDTNGAACVNLVGPAYTDCMKQVREYCYTDCNGESSNCNQGCADFAQNCLTDDQDCIADCIQEFEDSLKGLKF